MARVYSDNDIEVIVGDRQTDLNPREELYFDMLSQAWREKKLLERMNAKFYSGGILKKLKIILGFGLLSGCAAHMQRVDRIEFPTTDNGVVAIQLDEPVMVRVNDVRGVCVNMEARKAKILFAGEKCPEGMSEIPGSAETKK